MLKAFEKKLRQVRFRCSVNLLVRWTGRILAAAGIAAVFIVLAEQLLAVELISPVSAWILFGGAAFWIVLLWAINQPSRAQVSILLDDRMKIRERFSTTLAFADSTDPFAEAARREARHKAETLQPAGHFPIKASRCWVYVVGVWLLAAAFSFIPQQDLLGFEREAQAEERKARKIDAAKTNVKEAAAPVKLAVKRMGRPELAEALSKLDQMPKDATPQEIKRQAIKALGDLSEQIKKMQSSAELESLNMMKKMLKQLRGSPDMFSQKLRQALAKGNFGDASKALEEMRKKLEESNMTEEQRKKLSEELQKLGKQIQELAKKNSELEKELEKLGLGKKLAKMNEKQMREALQKQGLNKQQIEELMKKAAACKSASKSCSKLGDAMAVCGMGSSGLSGDDLAGLMDELDQLQAMKDDLAAMQASLGQIARCMGGLGEGMCEGMGMGEYKEGYSERYGQGTGGPGTGYGPRDIDETGDTSTDKTKAKTKTGEGPIVASWYFKGSQIKGETRREFSEVVQAGRDSASEAIKENEIPRKYQGAVKNYFGQLEEAGGE